MEVNDIIFSIELILSLICIYKIYNYYSKKNINCLISFNIKYTFFSLFLFIIFVPYDIEISYYETKEGFIKTIISIFFGLIYFISLIYGWFLSDFINYYENSSNFNMCSRAYGAICDMILNVIKKGVFIILGIIVLIFLIPIIILIYVSKGDTIQFLIKNILILISFPGTLFFIILIGMSLFRLPKDIYYNFDFKSRINLLYKRMGKIDKKLEEDKNILFDYYIQLDKTIKKYDENKSEKTISKTLTKISESLAFGVEGKSRKLYQEFKKNATNYEIDISINKIDERVKENEKDKKEEDYIINETRILGKINKDLRLIGSEIERLIGLRNICYNEWLEKKSFLIKNHDSLIEDKLILKDISGFKEIIYNFAKPISIIIIIILLLINIGIIFLEFLYYFPNFIKNDSFKEKDLFFHKYPITKILLLIPFFYFIFLSLYTLFSFGIENYFYLYEKGKTDSVSFMYITKMLMRISGIACVHIINMINLFYNLKQTKIESYMGFKKDAKHVKEDLYRYALIFSFFLLILIAILNLFDIPKILLDKFYFKKEIIDENELIERGKNVMYSLNMKETININV
jgi:hypothetical protein